MIRLMCTVGLVQLFASPGHAQTVVQRDRDGNRTGSITREGDRFVAGDANGNRIGSSKRDGDTIRNCDAMGNLVGTSTIKR